MAKPRAKTPPKENQAAIVAGAAILAGHRLFSHLIDRNWSPARASWAFPPEGYARLVLEKGYQGALAVRIEANPWRRASPAEWANVFAQAVLHFYMGHAEAARADDARRQACECLGADFLRQLEIGERPEGLAYPDRPLPGRDAESLAEFIRGADEKALAGLRGCGLAGAGRPTFEAVRDAPPATASQRRHDADALAAAIRASLVDAIAQAGDTARGPVTARRNPNSLAERARSWFVASYPLLGALAAAFDIVEDADLCVAMDIAIAAVDSEMRRVYVNPRFPWTYPKMQFVIAHELLHVGLRHEARRQGRDAYLWNVACDYVINGWLMEMGVGEMPTDGLLLDPELGFEKESAEAIYDRIVGDLRLIRRLNKARTLRGQGKVDVLGDRPPSWWTGPGTDLDAFYRRALAEGLDLHLSATGRGELPGELIEEIRALQHPPIAWDVRLGQWMDAFFPPLERRRSFARASRRQASTPDIPRPVWLRPEERMETRTFGVILDTSGSMPPRLLATALGAIASYAMSREVPMVRVMQCDAGVHDMGYVAPDALLQRVEVRGRGGTVLQPAVSRLETEQNFPKDAPILIITDGACDVLGVRREHAYLMPEGARLPFRTSAPQFRFERPDGG